MKTLRSPLGKARNSGSSGGGVHHFTIQRFMALLLLPITAWFIWLALCMIIGGNFADVRGFFESICNASLGILLIVAGFYHASIGLQNVLDDYVQGEKLNKFLVILIKMYCVALGIGGILAILKIYLSS